MSRRGHPRRFRDILAGAALALGLASALFPAAAQPRSDSVARTDIGGSRNAGRCNVAIMHGQIDDVSLAYCTNAIERDRLVRNDLVVTLVNRGVMLMRRRDFEAAIADFDAAIARDEDNGEAYLNRGAAFIQMGRPGPAVASLTLALSHGVSEPYKAYYNRGAARESLGDIRGAYEDYSYALQIRPNWDPAEAELERFVRTGRERVAQIMSAEEGATP